MSAGKVLASVFWDAHGILFIDYLEKCRISLGTVAVYPSMLGLNASIAFDSDPLRWFHSISTAHNTPH